jgi:SAM-dependent methyltransferase
MNFTMQQVRDFWDSAAGIYERENTRVDAIHNQRFVEAAKYLALNGQTRLLNIWSRDGGAIPFLRNLDHDFELVNAELSPKMLDIARKRYPAEEFLECSLHQLPFPDASFDTVLSLETLEHVPDPRLFLAEVFRVLKTQGQLVMSLPPARAEMMVKIYGLFCGGHGEGPHRFLATDEVKALLKAAGFRILLHKPTVYLPLGNKYSGRLNKFLEDHIKSAFLQEFAIRQFYVCRK